MATVPAMFILSSETGRLLAVDSDGAVQAVPGLEDLAIVDVAAGATGHLFIATRGVPGSLARFDVAGKVLHPIAVAQGGDEGIAALARSPGGTLYCAEYRHGRAELLTEYAETSW